MPVHSVVKNGKIVGYQWGQHGKIYPTKKQAEKQAIAAYSSGYKEKNKSKRKSK